MALQLGSLEGVGGAGVRPRLCPRPPRHSQGGAALSLGSFQGESRLYCYEVVPQQLALSPGNPVLWAPSLGSSPPALTGLWYS